MHLINLLLVFFAVNLSIVRAASCGNQNQAPCAGGKCALSTLQVIKGLCRRCGSDQTPPCPIGGCQKPLGTLNNLCRRCGLNGQPACDHGGCAIGLQPMHGICSATCGLEVNPPCDNGCRDGRYVNQVGYCVSPAVCAGKGESCVTGNWGTSTQGKLCCGANRDGGAGPLVCIWGHCQACVPHGQAVQPRGVQLCCQPGDQVVLDLDTGGSKCDIPDGPKDS